MFLYMNARLIATEIPINAVKDARTIWVMKDAFFSFLFFVFDLIILKIIKPIPNGENTAKNVVMMKRIKHAKIN